MKNQFNQEFAKWTYHGDKITGTVDGFDVVATIYLDEDGGPPDEHSDGFWPVTGDENKKEAGYVLPENFDVQMEHAQAVMEAWKNAEWFYCGVAVRVSFDGLELTGEFDNAVWSIECNYPQLDDSHPNTYLTEVANDLLGEALTQAKQKLADVCKKAVA